ncbi:ABC transporter substrate-binding protein [Variovorax guangxiensis]|uniref:ABC transporter substrate-binding protein n=1 Tax=Variovorax guangxiensis TaxID=1775474 RepID=UPI002864C828|nr:ABC transporter substrate-binding protein [Variovorax guangxiensis]MDR6861387.1 putative ABC transport system substrate-binding protein [Variovorax guangxiensis]
MKGRRELLVASLAVLAPITSYAQSVGRVRRIGVLGNVAPPANAGSPIQVFIATLRDLGWIEAKTVAFDYRWAQQRYERFPALARELVKLGVDLIMVTGGVTAALAAKQATTTIPILAVAVADPVKFGLVASFARPGGNVTGIAQPLADWGKWLELAREAVAGATRIAVIGNPTNIVYADYVAQNEAAARQLGIELQMIPVAQVDQLAPAFEAMRVAHADALVVGTDNLYFSNLTEILERARASRLPVIAPFRPAADMGALVAWGFDIRFAFRRAAAYADSILRGTPPADLPMEQPSRFELVINLKIAKGLGLTIPQSMLLRADEVIR